MLRMILKMPVLGLLSVVAGGVVLCAQEPPADVILTNGKIITVDDRFSIAQAIAIRGDRFAAVGSNQQITQRAGPNTMRIDLKGKSVTPGFIDHHGHYLREGSTWAEEVRLDGVESRKQAVELLSARAKMTGSGKWVYTLMGWTLDQFTDDQRPFARKELDEIAPDNPVFLQEAYYRVYLNSRGLEALGLKDNVPDPEWVPRNTVVRDSTGKLTGVILEDGVRPAEAKILEVPRTKENIEASHLAMIRDLNRAGLTAIGASICNNSAQVPSAGDIKATYRRWSEQGKLNIRVYCIDGFGVSDDEHVEEILPKIAQIKLFQGNLYFDDIAYGETWPGNDNMLSVRSNQKAADWARFERIAAAVAKAGMPTQIHATLQDSIDGYLDRIEKINKQYPIRILRWSLIHIDEINQSQIDRMKALGMYAGVHMRPSVMGGIFHRIRGDRSFDTPPMRMIQDSGIMWGIGTDFNLDQYRPFTTLWFCVTGKMVGGAVVNHQTISREDALIAHTRRNAYFVFQENNLGSIQPGKLADLVVLDRDYLTVPADQIKDIKPVMTMVGGKIVYDASTKASSEASK
jgi:predicted amidohydrolase YtcJ